MNEDTRTHSLQRTTIDSNKDKIELSAWISPLECEGCGGRVDVFYRYNRPDDARCANCGCEWKIE